MGWVPPDVARVPEARAAGPGAGLAAAGARGRTPGPRHPATRAGPLGPRARRPCCGACTRAPQVPLCSAAWGQGPHHPGPQLPHVAPLSRHAGRADQRPEPSNAHLVGRGVPWREVVTEEVVGPPRAARGRAPCRSRRKRRERRQGGRGAGGGGGGELTQDVVAFDVYNHCWRSLTRLPAQPLGHSVCVAGNFLFVLGGEPVGAAPARPQRTARLAVMAQVHRYGPALPRVDDGAPLCGKHGPISGAAPWARGSWPAGARAQAASSAGFGGNV